MRLSMLSFRLRLLHPDHQNRKNLRRQSFKLGKGRSAARCYKTWPPRHRVLHSIVEQVIRCIVLLNQTLCVPCHTVKQRVVHSDGLDSPLLLSDEKIGQNAVDVKRQTP